MYSSLIHRKDLDSCWTTFQQISRTRKVRTILHFQFPSLLFSQMVDPVIFRPVFVHYTAIDAVQEGPRGFKSLCEVRRPLTIRSTPERLSDCFEQGEDVRFMF